MIRAITAFLVPLCNARSPEIEAYCRDIDKIVLDKGLIAMIVGAVSLLLAWRLEAFKSRLKMNEERRRLELVNVQGLFDKVHSIGSEIEIRLGYIAQQFHNDTAALIQRLDQVRDAYRAASEKDLAGADLAVHWAWLSSRIEPGLADSGLAEIAAALKDISEEDAAEIWEAARGYLSEWPSGFETLNRGHVYLTICKWVFPRCARQHRAEIGRQCEAFGDLICRFMPPSYKDSERLMYVFTNHIVLWSSKFPDPLFNYSLEGMRAEIRRRMVPIKHGMQLALREIASAETNSRRFGRYVRKMETALAGLNTWLTVDTARVGPRAVSLSGRLRPGGPQVVARRPEGRE